MSDETVFLGERLPLLDSRLVGGIRSSSCIETSLELYYTALSWSYFYISFKNSSDSPVVCLRCDRSSASASASSITIGLIDPAGLMPDLPNLLFFFLKLISAGLMFT